MPFFLNGNFPTVLNEDSKKFLEKIQLILLTLEDVFRTDTSWGEKTLRKKI